MTANNTVRHDGDVQAFIENVEHQQRREDAVTLLSLFKKITGWTPAMWGDSLVGFGEYHYKYASGREGDWLLTGFSPRKQNTTVYIMNGFAHYGDLLAKLGKHKHSSSCLYVNKLGDIDMHVLKTIITRSVEHMKQTYSFKP